MADTDSITVRVGKDLKLDNAIQVGSNESVALPGTFRYNSLTDTFEGFTSNVQNYNGSQWATMSLGIASDTTLGGVKIGNNLGITSTGILNATAEAVSQKVQRILLIAKPTDAGDYSSINQCLDQFFGYDSALGTFPDGELANLDKTDYPDPSSSSPYVIKVTPGIYSESDTTISLPPYVSLVGENRQDCIIKMDSNISVECRNGNYISGLTFDLSNANAGSASTVDPIGISANSAANTVVIRDCDFVLSQLAANTTCIDYRGGVTGGLVENCRVTASNIALPAGYTNETLTAITCNNAAVVVNNVDVFLEGYRAAKTALKIQSNSVVTSNNCRLVVNELNTTSSGHQNNAVLVENSDLVMNYSQIECQGYDLLLDNATHQCQGINMTSNVSAGSVSLSDLQFIHYEDASQYDEILVELATQDFSTVFSRNDYIKVSGASNSRNNQVFQVANVYSEDISGTDYSILQLTPGNNLADEVVSSGSVTIRTLFSLQLNCSRVLATNATLRFTPYSGQSTLLDNYQIVSSRTLLQGGNPNVGANNLRTDKVQEIVVSANDGDFTSVKAAVDSITARGDSSAEKPYMVTIRPGKYLETGTITMPDWVTISGDSVGAVELEFNNSTGSYAQNTALTLSGNCSVENLVFRVNDTLDVGSAQSNVTAIASDNLAGVTLGDSGSESSASTLANIRLVNLAIILGSGITTTGERHGIHLFKTNADVHDVTISATTADISEAEQIIVGYKQTLGDTKVYNLAVSISGSESNSVAYGAMLDRSLATVNNPQISCICSGSTGVVNRGWFATNVANTDDSVLTVSGFTNILAGGSIRSSGGVTNQSLFSDYNSTLIARSLLMQGTAFTYNDSENSVPNSFLKTLDSYFISVDGGLITNISESDTRGYPVIVNDSLHIGDPAGALGAQGGQNVLVGIRVGTKSTQGYRNTMLGVDTGDSVVTATDDTYIGYAAGNNTLGSLNTLVGSNVGALAVTGDRMMVVGANAWKDGNNSNDSVIMGPYAGSNVYNSDNLVFVGANVAPNADGATDLVVVGPFAASNVTGLSNSVIMGTRAGDELVATGDDSVIIGHEAGQTVETARTVTMVGSQAGQYAQQALDNTLIGYRAGRGVSSGATGNKITAVGVRTAAAVTSGAELVAVGTGALESVTTGRRLVAIGSELLTAGSGSGPAAAVTTALDGVFVGGNIATSLTSGDRVIVVGHHSANRLDGTNDMLVFGCNSASNFSGSASTDGLSIVMGNRAATKQQKARAIVIGHEAAQNANAEDLIAVGYRTARTVKGAGNVFFGNYAAGISNDDVAAPLNGTYNVIMGNYAGFSMSSASFNVVIGGGNQSVGAAGYDLTSGEGNVLLGYLAGRNLSTGDFNLLLGKNAGQQLAWGARNFIMGADAAPNIGSTDVNPTSLSNDNLILGTQAAFKYTSASQLLVVGYQAGYNGTTGQNSVIIGNQAGYTNQVGRDVVYIGNKSGYLNTQSRTVAIGDGAAEYSSTAERFVYIGYRAGRGKGASVSLNNTGDRSVMIGYQAGSNVTTGYQAVYIGYEAGCNNEEGQKSIMIGPNAGRDSATNRSVFIGTTESDSTGIGYQAAGDNLICIGINTGVSLTSGAENILIGSHSGESLTTGNSHVFIGDDAGRDLTTGNSSVLIGEYAGKSLVSGDRAIAIGKHAGRNMGTAVNDVVLMGNEAGLNVAADATIALGNKAAKMLRTGTGVIAIGDQAARDNETAADLIAIGSNAGAVTTGVDGQSDSILIGDQAGSNLTTSYQNTVLGSSALKDATTANAVIAIGFEAGLRLGSTNNVKPTGSQYETTIIGYKAASTGDIGANCTIIGNRAAENVDNPRIFAGNTFNGPRAGQNANTSVDSVVLGGANQLGSGGVSNFIAGTGTGANVGIERPYTLTTTSIISNNGFEVTIGEPIAIVSYYFKSGYDIMIEDSDQSQFHRTKLVEIISTSASVTTLVFQTPFLNTGGETISTGATVRPLSKISTAVGILDDSTASASTLLGTQVGSSVTEGSKLVGVGWQAMFKNKTGKYNNVFGTQAGYNIISDNSTCIGTQSGFSIDEYAATEATANTFLLSFNSNTNTITALVGAPLSSFVFSSIFTVEGSSLNNGKYTSETANATSLVVQGLPNYIEVGVGSNIQTSDTKINNAYWTFANLNINAGDTSIIAEDGFLALGDNTSANIEILQTLGDATIINISGSKYNDGIHYVVSDFTSSHGNTGVIQSLQYQFENETFDSNVTIIARALVGSERIVTGSDFYSYVEGAPFNVFFGPNKGVYRSSYIMSKDAVTRRNLLPMSLGGAMQNGVFGNPSVLNYAVPIAEGIDYQNIVESDDSLNVIYTSAYIETTDITLDDILYNIDGSYSASFNSNLNGMGSGTIVHARLEHSVDRITDRGAYINNNVDSNNPSRSSNLAVTPPIFGYIRDPVTGNIAVKDTRVVLNEDIYKVDTAYQSNTHLHMYGYDIFYQTANITPHSGATFTMIAANSTIIANDLYQFSRLVAPCAVKDSNGDYYLVTKNDYPFQHLIVDSDATPIASDTTTAFISAHSICCHRKTSNLAIMEAGIEYTIFGGVNNTKTITSVSGDSRAIHEDSVYLTDNSNITEQISNNRLIYLYGNQRNDSPNSYVAGYYNGYFKNVELSAANVDIASGGSNVMTLTFNNNSTAVFYAFSGITSFQEDKSGVPLTTFDQITITGSNNAGTFEIINSNNASGFSPPYTVNVWNTATVSAETGVGIDIKCNEFRQEFKEDFQQIDLEIGAIRVMTGGLSDFLRFQPVQVSNMSDVTSNGLSNTCVTTLGPSLNYTVADWDNFDGAVIGNSNLYASNVVTLSETVPNDCFISSAENGIGRYYAIALGTPVPPANGDAELEKRNISTPPVGFIDAFLGRSVITGSQKINYVLNYSVPTSPFDEGVQGNVAVYSNGSVILTDIAPVGSNVVSKIQFPTYNVDPLNGPFKQFKPGMIVNLSNGVITDADYDSSDGNTFTYMVRDVIDGNHFTIDTRYSNITTDTVFPFGEGLGGNLAISIGQDPFIESANIGFIVSDRYNFAKTANVSLYSNETTNGYGQDSPYNLVLATNDVLNYGIYAQPLITRIPSGAMAPDKRTVNFAVDDSDICKCLEWRIAETEMEEVYNQFYDTNDHTLIIPTSNLSFIGETTAFSFANVSITGATVTFTSSNTITSATSDLSAFSAGQIILISGADESGNNGYFKISTATNPTSSTITLDSAYGILPLTATTDDSGVTIRTNTINSSIGASNLAVYDPGNKLIIGKTELNNGVFNIVHTTRTSNNSVYLSESVTTESPIYCRIDKSVLLDEAGVVTGSSDISFNSSNNTITTSSGGDEFLSFSPGQKLRYGSNTYAISTSQPITSTTIYIDENIASDLLNTSAVIYKLINIALLGSPIASVSDLGTDAYHYLDAQGNNIMIGSFTGKYSGAISRAIHNIYIGNKVGQTNHGSGCVFLGNETGTAANAQDGATTYNNRLAIYKTNFAGVPANPLIGGDFASGRVGIYTIDPDSLVSGTLDTATRLVVNGAVRASAHNTFTGTHIINISDTVARRVKPGYILKSTGKVNKMGIIDTIVECDITTTAMNKAVYGVYSHCDYVKNKDGISETLYYCASVGEGCILVCNIGGDPQNGDYVMSSPILGYGQLQPDDIQHSYTVAKITENINWNAENIRHVRGPDGKTYKAVLASCTYHCG